MRKPFGVVLLGLGICVLAMSAPAMGFTTLPFFNNGTESPDDDMNDAGRWSNESGTFAGSNVRALGGGLEYAIAHDFYDRIMSSFVDSPSRDQVRQAIERAFNRWANGSPLSFRDITAQIPAIRDAASPGSGAEIDIFAIPGSSIEFVGNPLSGNTIQQFNSTDPRGTNGSTLPGWTITSADILINQDRQYYLDANNPQVQQLQGQGQFLVHFESLMTHEIGHAIGLEHPDVWWTRNFDTDSNPNNTMNINCNSPAQGLQISTNFNRNAVMAAEGSHLLRLNLTPDDLAGRAFLYPSCSGSGGSPAPPPPSNDPPPSTPPPPTQPPSSGGSGGGLSGYDSNSSCALEEPEFFALVDDWISGSVDNGLFFEGVDAWIGQSNICAALMASVSNGSTTRGSATELAVGHGHSLTFSTINSTQRIVGLDIYSLDGRQQYSKPIAHAQSLVWRFHGNSGMVVANGVYITVVMVEDALTGAQYRDIYKVAIIR